MKNVYLENTNNHHDKFYHMIENKDGASFTASWGRTGSNGRTQIYGMNEWDKKYREKINRGYKDTTIIPPSSNWIQGMSVAQRKKQGITTVQPLVRPKKAKKKPKAIKKTAKVNNSHLNKLRTLKMTMENWTRNDGKSYALDSTQGRMYESDLYKIGKLIEKGTKSILESDKEFLGDPEFLTKEEMLDMNVLFKAYGGKRKTN